MPSESTMTAADCSAVPAEVVGAAALVEADPFPADVIGGARDEVGCEGAFVVGAGAFVVGAGALVAGADTLVFGADAIGVGAATPVAATGTDPDAADAVAGAGSFKRIKLDPASAVGAPDRAWLLPADEPVAAAGEETAALAGGTVAASVGGWAVLAEGPVETAANSREGSGTVPEVVASDVVSGAVPAVAATGEVATAAPVAAPAAAPTTAPAAAPVATSPLVVGEISDAASTGGFASSVSAGRPARCTAAGAGPWS